MISFTNWVLIYKLDLKILRTKTNVSVSCARQEVSPFTLPSGLMKLTIKNSLSE